MSLLGAQRACNAPFLRADLSPWVPDLLLCRLPTCGQRMQNETPNRVNERMQAYLQEPYRP